jgi:uncharacterized protein YggE
MVVLFAYTLGTRDRPAAQATTFLPSAAATPSSAGIEVVGTGKIAGTPDIVRLDLGITVTRPEAASSLDAASAATTKVIKALTARGVKSKDIKTAGLSLQPEYDYTKSTSVIRGYTASQQIAVTLRNLRSAGSAIGAAVAAGGDATRVHGLALDLAGDSKLLAQARLAAIADARAKAEAYAKATGRSLGPVTVISENTSTPSPLRLDRSEAADMAATKVPVEPGTQQVAVSVRVVWSLV